MKQIVIGSAMFALVLATHAQASEFEGPYAGFILGSNKSSATALADKNSSYLGLKAGHNWDWNSFLVGAEAFVDAHSSSYTGQDAGLDARLGLPMDRWLPYAKLGLVGTTPGARLHGGLGLEYSLTRAWSVNAEWTTDKKSSGATSYKNNNIALGLNYHFGAEPAKAEPIKAEPVKAVAAPAVAESAPVEKVAQPVYKTIFSDKPLTLEGTSFATGSAKLNASANVQLNQVVEFAAKYKDAQLKIIGYTDDRGDAKKNLTLSAARAESVKAYLVKHGVAADRLSTKGEGASNPVASNKTAEGRAKNRRVEIASVVKEEKKVRVE